MASSISFDHKGATAMRERAQASRDDAEFRATLDANSDMFNAFAANVAATVKAHRDVCLAGGAGLLLSLVLMWYGAF